MNEKKLVFAVFAVVIVFLAVFALFLYAITQEGFFSSSDGQHSSGAYIYPSNGGYTIHLPRPLGVFAYPNEGDYIGLIGPGYFELIEQIGSWAQIYYDEEAFWVNLDFLPPTDSLEGFFADFPHAVSIFYMNVETGFSFTHRENIVYTSASLNKLSHALYVYYLSETGLADLSRMHTFNWADLRGGTGVIRHFVQAGQQFTHAELLRYSVRDSDNTAFAILYNHYTGYAPSYAAFWRDRARDMTLVGVQRTHRVTAADFGLVMQYVHEFIESDTPYARHLQYSMLNSDVPIIMSDYHIAQKYGHWQGAFHDVAIIYAPSPYILVVLTNLDQLEPFHAFYEISMLFQNFNDRYFRPN